MKESIDQFSPVLNGAKWDWYQVTIHLSELDSLMLVLERFYPLCDWQITTPQNGYQNARALVLGDRKLLICNYGGNGGTANIVSTSEDSRQFYDALQSWGGSYRPTRVDSCIDWDEEGLFNALSASLISFALDNDLKLSQLGDWQRGKSRTLYIGSPKSPVQLRLYEKGYQLDGQETNNPNWVRLEVQIRPAKERRSTVSKWTPADCFCAGWVALAVERFFIVAGKSKPIGVINRPSDKERQRAWIAKQAANILMAWRDECGSDEALGVALVAKIREVSTL